MVSGDDVVVKETTALLGDVEGAVVKWASGFHSAQTFNARVFLSIDSRESKESRQPNQRIQALQTQSSNSFGRPFQKLSSVRTLSLPQYCGTHGRAQHKIHGQGHDRGVKVSGIHRHL
jgi:hypothetical protein